MKLTKKSEYALLSLVDLARYYPTQTRTIAQIAQDNNIPKKYLEQILLLLKSVGWIKSTRGTRGGYELLKAPDQISMADVVRLIDGAIAPVSSVSTHFFEESPLSSNTKILRVLKDIRDYASNKMEITHLGDLI